MEELEIWRTATLLIRQHGEDAVFEAALRADGLFAKTDYAGAAFWKRIGRAIEELERLKPRKDEALN